MNDPHKKNEIIRETVKGNSHIEENREEEKNHLALYSLD